MKLRARLRMSREQKRPREISRSARNDGVGAGVSDYEMHGFCAGFDCIGDEAAVEGGELAAVGVGQSQ